MKPCKPWRFWGRRFTCALLIVTLSACGWKITPPPNAVAAVPRKPVADAVVLTVSDGALIWGKGELGYALRNELVALGSFRSVHYPIEPRGPLPDRLTVDASGGIKEEIGLGVVKSIIIGALFFIPVGLIRFHRDFVLTAEVTLRLQGKEQRRFTIETETGVSHTMFSETDDYEPAMRRAAFSDLARRIAAELSSSP